MLDKGPTCLVLSGFIGKYSSIYECGAGIMKVVNSLKTLKTRDRNCRIVRRKGRVYVINKKNPRYKARQG